jgi:hypothetical protein
MPLSNKEFSESSRDTQSQILFNELKKTVPNMEVISGWLTTSPNCLSLQDKNYKTPLHYLVSRRDIDYVFIENILKKIPKHILSTFDSNFDNPLHLACKLIPPDLKLIALLIKHGADPTLFDGNNFSVFSYPRIVNNPDALNILYDGVNEQQKMVNENLLPTLDELQKQYGSNALAKNMHWALNAMNFVINTNVLMAANNLKGNALTAGWSKKINELMRIEFNTFNKGYKGPRSLDPYIAKMADLLKSHRGGGDCFYQTSCAFVYLLQKSVTNIEYYEMDGGSHHFIVIGRAPGSDPNKPDTWGDEAVICDPWAKRCFLASDFHKPREYRAIHDGIPTPFPVFKETVLDIISNSSTEERSIPLPHQEQQKKVNLSIKERLTSGGVITETEKPSSIEESSIPMSHQEQQPKVDLSSEERLTSGGVITETERLPSTEESSIPMSHQEQQPKVDLSSEERLNSGGVITETERLPSTEESSIPMSHQEQQPKVDLSIKERLSLIKIETETWKLMQLLKTYDQRLKGYLVSDPAGGYGANFTFFKKQRSISREINHHLAKTLIDQLAKAGVTVDSIEHIFSTDNLLKIKTAYIKEKQYSFTKDGYINLGINSSELNKIIDEAHNFIDNQSSSNVKK